MCAYVSMCVFVCARTRTLLYQYIIINLHIFEAWNIYEAVSKSNAWSSITTDLIVESHKYTKMNTKVLWYQI